MDQETRILELRALLSRCRARLRPEDVGLPATVRRRVPGLRREEVAELVGVSPNWYGLFELGSAERRFSPAFVERVANALQLDERERALLFRLALPEIRLAVEHFERSTQDGALRSLREIRALVRRVTAAATFAEAALTAVETISEILSPSSVALAILVPERNAPRVIAAGPRAAIDLGRTGIASTCMVANYPNRQGLTTFSENRSRYRETICGAFEFKQGTSDGQTFVVSVAPSGPTASEALARNASGTAGTRVTLSNPSLNSIEYWDWAAKLDVRSVMTHGLFTEGRYRGNLCALWSNSRAVASLDVEILQTASAILELAAAPGGFTAT